MFRFENKEEDFCPLEKILCRFTTLFREYLENQNVFSFFIFIYLFLNSNLTFSKKKKKKITILIVFDKKEKVFLRFEKLGLFLGIVPCF